MVDRVRIPRGSRSPRSPPLPVVGPARHCGPAVDRTGNAHTSGLARGRAHGPILAAMPDVEVVPLTTVLGAVVSGVTLTPDLEEAEVTALRQALLDHKVLFFRRQSL